MITAQFMLCGLWCGADPVMGALVVPEGRGAIQLAGGVNAVLPALTFGAVVGVGSRVDVGARYEMYAGLAHALTATARVRLAERWALVNSASYGFFAVDEISGIQSSRAPFGSGFTTTHGVAWSRWNRDGLHVSLAAGVTVRWLRLRDVLDVVDLVPDVTLHTAHVEVTTEWAARSGGSWWVSVRALVPVQANFQVFGFLPMVLVGRSWGLP